MGDWIAANKGAGPWKLQGQPDADDWLANKGAGVWGFLPQRDKLGYINNPRWTSTPASPVDHEPCGYWLKGAPEIPFTAGPVWGAGVDEYGSLTFGYSASNGVPLWYTPDFWHASVFPCYHTFRENPGPFYSKVSSGGNHTALVRSDGTLWGCGLNRPIGILGGSLSTLGLGPGSLNGVFNLVQLGTDTDWAHVACGGFQTFAIKANGTMWATGQNTTDNGYIPYSSLGVGDNLNRDVFTQVPGNTWKWVSSSGSHAVAIKTDGTLWITGYNLYGQLGNGTADYFPTHQSFEQVGGDTNWLTAVAAGNFTLALNSLGRLYATGYNLDGALGLNDLINRNVFTVTGNGTSDWTGVRAGGQFSVGMKGNGTAWSTGSNNYGQLGLGDTTGRNAFTQIPNIPPYLQISPGQYHTMLIGKDNSLWAVGNNTYGELGLGDTADRSTFTRVGTETNWLKLWDTGYYTNSLVLRTPGLVNAPGAPVGRPNPVWPLPT